ncbi:MAG TPA: hypothetical protein VKW06_11560 [Candidatus Angelobacter sp.]|nr:hypothetical protein [Candidatus Angelobacter sp.]
MTADQSFWLIGVKGDELTAAAGSDFLEQFQYRFRGPENMRAIEGLRRSVDGMVFDLQHFQNNGRIQVSNVLKPGPGRCKRRLRPVNFLVRVQRQCTRRFKEIFAS